MKLSPEQSLAGILEPVFAIRTEDDLGIGDTEGVRQMINWCHRHHLNIFQTLPINEISDDNSPYNAISSLAIEPTTIAISPGHIPDLAPKKFHELATPEVLAELHTGPVNYPKVKALKRALLAVAFESFLKRHFNKDDGARPLGRFTGVQSSESADASGGTDVKRLEGRAPDSRADQFRAFLQQNAEWLSDYALFRVLMEENGDSPAWDRWSPEHRGPRRAHTWLLSLPEARRDELTRKQLFFAYVQWIAFSQWQEIKAHGDAKKVYLMGDIPFGVGRYSADVWANRSLFDLDWSGGAPPERTFKVDPFTEKWGQNWGIPNYRWDELRRHNFEWWRVRVGNIQKVFHLYRIDHVLGFFRIYSFPWTPDRNAEFLPLTEAEAAAKTGGRLPGFKQLPDDTSEHKGLNQAQGEEILRVVLEGSGETTVVAEDLGCVPEYVSPTLEKLGIPGFRIPMLFREHDGAYSDPKKYPRLSLAQPATHDHTPLALLWQECWANIDAGRDAENNRRELQRMMTFAGLRRAEASSQNQSADGGQSSSQGTAPTGCGPAEAGLNRDEPPREFDDRLHEAFTRTVMESNSWLVVFQIQDVFGQTARFNTPGSVSTSNWSYRLPQTVKQLDADPQLLAKTRMFSRAAKEAGRVI